MEPLSRDSSLMMNPDSHATALVVIGLLATALPGVAPSACAQDRTPLLREDSLAGLEGGDRARVLVDLTVDLRSLAPSDAVAYGQEALELLDRLDDPATMARALNEMAWAYMELGEYDLAIGYAERGREIERLTAENTLQQLEAQHQQLEARQRSTLLGIMLLLAVVSLLLYRRSVVKSKLVAQVEVRRSLERVVQDRTLELQEVNLRLEDLTLTDALTGLKNRRYLAQTLNTDVATSLRMYRRAALEGGDLPGQADIVFFLLDLDHVKSVNDQYGHQTGDRVLVQVGEVLAGTCRASDTLLRWGGEEFLIVSRQVDRRHAEAFAERIRQRMADQVFDTDNGNEIRRTCSIGFASFPFIREKPDDLDWEKVVELADAGLYEVKCRGRNGWVSVSSTAKTVAGALTGGVESLERHIAQGVLAIEISVQA